MLQRPVVYTLVTGVIAALALALWVLLGSGLPWRRRGQILLAMAGAGVLWIAMFRLEGVSGDLVPQFAWRWSAKSTVMPESVSTASESPAITKTDLGTWPRFLGAQLDGTAPEIALQVDWSAHPPRVIWRRAVGAGWSGFAIANGLAFTQDQQEQEERVVCLDATTGKSIWVHAIPERYDTTLGGVGPRATPTIYGEQVFAQGGTGMLHALELRTGQVQWQIDLRKRFGSPMPEWGFSGSPLVIGDRVVIAAGGRQGLVALDRKTGETQWATPSDALSYASPMLASLHGEPVVIQLFHQRVAGFDPETGEQRWSIPWVGMHPKVTQPLILTSNRLMLSSGYGMGSAMWQMFPGDDFPKEQWRSKRLKAKFSNMIVQGEAVYGLDDGVMVCLNAQTGERHWKAGRYGHAQMLQCGMHLLILAEDGVVVLMAMDDGAHRELARLPVFDSKTWNSPALAGRYLFLRNDREAVCLELPVLSAP